MNKGKITALSLVAASTLLAAACTTTPGNTPSSSAPSAGSNTGGAATALANFTAISDKPTFKAPPDASAFDAKKAAGKHVFYLNTNDALPVSAIWRDLVVSALERYGVKVTKFDGKGSSAEYNRGMQQAIAQHVDLIFNLAVDPKLVQQSIKQAAAAGIPVVSATDGKPILKDNKDFVDGLVAEVSYDYDKVGALEADWFVSDSGGKGHALFISNLDQPSSTYVLNSFKDEVASLCPQCKVSDKDVPAGQVATSLPTLIQTAVRADPSINYVVPGYDFQVPMIESALKLAGLTDKVKIGSWNAAPAVMSSLKKQGTAVHMDMGAPNSWFGYAIADTILRVLTGVTPAVWGQESSNYMGIRGLTKDNVQSLDVSKYNDGVIFGLSEETVRGEFEKIWGAP